MLDCFLPMKTRGSAIGDVGTIVIEIDAVASTLLEAGGG
jgi:hypothetical protein